MSEHPPVPRTDPKTAVRRYFDRTATDYLEAYAQATTRGETFRERRRLVLAMTRDPVGRVVDIGAEPGVFTDELVRRGATCVVADVSVEMLAAARRVDDSGAASDRVVHVAADVERLALRAGAFDTVLCVGVLQYLVAPERALAELARVTRPHGQVLVTFPNARSPLNRLHAAAITTARTARRGLRRVGFCADVDPTRLTFRDDIPNAAFDLAGMRAAAHAAGLLPADIACHGLLFPFTLPRLGVAAAAWNRAARRAPPAIRRRWGREMVIRFLRRAGAVCAFWHARRSARSSTWPDGAGSRALPSPCSCITR